MNKFDLNMEDVLEDWEGYHAIRELIANALDEQFLTNSKPIIITKVDYKKWIIRDFGRGINEKHFTQKENKEKLNHPHLIGKFGVGLKDALATFDRKGINVEIDSKFGNYTLNRDIKSGTKNKNIKTLHIFINEPLDNEFLGTQITLEGCEDDDIEKAKSLFLEFSNPNILETTDFGEIIKKETNQYASIYFNGLKVAEEEDFLFSYNITNLTKRNKKELNRERSNVGRAAYSNRIKDILLKSTNSDVSTILLDAFNSSNSSDIVELGWIDVSVHIIKQLNAQDKYVFGTQDEQLEMTNDVRDVILDDKEFKYIPKAVKQRLQNESDVKGNTINTVNHILQKHYKSFQYDFIDYKDLSRNEKQNFKLIDKVLTFFDANEYNNRIKISNTLHLSNTSRKTLGVYDRSSDLIIIKKEVLNDTTEFLGVLIHELVHAITKEADLTREFEHQLTDVIGMLAEELFANKLSRFFR